MDSYLNEIPFLAELFSWLKSLQRNSVLYGFPLLPYLSWQNSLLQTTSSSKQRSAVRTPENSGSYDKEERDRQTRKWLCLPSGNRQLIRIVWCCCSKQVVEGERLCTSLSKSSVIYIFATVGLLNCSLQPRSGWRHFKEWWKKCFMTYCALRHKHKDTSRSVRL